MTRYAPEQQPATFGKMRSFGPFELHPERRELVETGQPRQIGGRALDLLIALTDRAGEVVGKDELISRAWPSTVVDESGLRVQIAAIRKILRDGRSGNRYIINVPGRGYSFIAPLNRQETSAVAGAMPRTHAKAGADAAVRLPVRNTRVIGRSDTFVSLKAKLLTWRFVTIVGSGGIGKTTLALALAAALGPRFADGIVFVDLAPLADPQLVASTVASALGIALPAEDALGRLAEFLKAKHILLLLDTCEHVINQVAALAEHLFRSGPGIHLLATSREPLLVDGEWTERLLPLGLPPVTPAVSRPMDAANALGFPAIELFAERAAASCSGFRLTDQDVPTVAAICRQLDGIPLAIELAAASVEAFGLAGLASRLDDRFALLTRGRRTALPRQQTLRATLDWSYETLTQAEKTVLRRLAMFKGWFSDDACRAVATDEGLASAEILACLGSLVSKSLIVTDTAGAALSYRMLDTTRVYALSQLSQGDERPGVTRRYAEYFCSRFERLEAEWQSRPTAEALTEYAGTINDIRAALSWSFSPEGDATTGLRLTAASAYLWFHLSLMDEYRARVDTALEVLRGLGTVDPRVEMRLLLALGHALYHAGGLGPKMAAAFTQGLAIAERLGSTAHQLQAVWGLWAVRGTSGDYTATIALAERYAALARLSGDADTILFADRTLALSLHWLGEHEGALQHTQSTLAHPATIARRTPGNGFQLDHLSAVRPIIARIQWLRGYPDQALATVKQIADDALNARHAPSACYLLAVAACPVATWMGEFTLAHALTRRLHDAATEHALLFWQMFARCYDVGLAVLEGGEVDPPAFLADARLGLRHLETLSTLHPVLLSDRILAGFDAGHMSWSRAETLRAKGERLLAVGAPDAELCFTQSMEIARRQQALAWELRAATSLARLWRDSDRRVAARELLEAVYGRFSEGFGTVDLVAARGLLTELGARF